MFIDASAIVAIIANESDRDVLVGKLKQTKHRSVSPIVVFEAVLGLKRIKSKTYDEVLAIVDEFLKIYAIKKMTMIDFTITKDALGAYSQFGKGIHPARLNMGDCFSYACAKKLKQPLLFKGNDFSKTDIQLA